MFLAWDGLVRICWRPSQDKNRNSDRWRLAAGAERSKRRDRLGVEGMERCGPGATFAAERPESTVSGLSERGRQREFSAKRKFTPSAGVVVEVGWEIPAERDLAGGRKLRLTESH